MPVFLRRLTLHSTPGKYRTASSAALTYILVFLRTFLRIHLRPSFYVALDTMASPAPSNNAQSEAKRRKLRKGTHSCWECKRRKMKCIFDPAKNSTICNGCRRRGSKCVSQDFPEEASLDGIERAHLHTRSNNTIYGKRKLKPSNEDPAGPDLGNPTHASIVSEPLLPFSHRSSDVRTPNLNTAMIVTDHLYSIIQQRTVFPCPLKANTRGCL